MDMICSCQSEREEGMSADGRMGNKKMKCVGGATEGKNVRRLGRMTENKNLKCADGWWGARR